MLPLLTASENSYVAFMLIKSTLSLLLRQIILIRILTSIFTCLLQVSYLLSDDQHDCQGSTILSKRPIMMVPVFHCSIGFL